MALIFVCPVFPAQFTGHEVLESTDRLRHSRAEICRISDIQTMADALYPMAEIARPFRRTVEIAVEADYPGALGGKHLSCRPADANDRTNNGDVVRPLGILTHGRFRLSSILDHTMKSWNCRASD
jgi:hypothetical protein